MRLSLRNDKTIFLFAFRDDYLSESTPSNDHERKAALCNVFAGVGWECPRILEAMEEVTEIYFDRVGQIRMENWTKGRTALIGDAAACVSLVAGEGTGLAMMETRVLAGELQRSAGNHVMAFSMHQALMHPFLGRKQASAAKFGCAFAPRTTLGIRFRDLVSGLLQIEFVADFVVGRDLRDDIELPDYELGSSRPRGRDGLLHGRNRGRGARSLRRDSKQANKRPPLSRRRFALCEAPPR